MDLGSDPTHSSTTSSSTARSSSSHVFTIPESLNIFYDFFFYDLFIPISFFSFGSQKLQKKTKILRNSFFYYFFFFSFCLTCLALQMENVVQKITQPIFIFGNLVNQNEKQKMG